MIVAILCCQYQQASASSDRLVPNGFHLEVVYKEAATNDTLVLLVAAKYLTNFGGKDFERVEAVKNASGVFVFNVKPSTNVGYWLLYKRNPFDNHTNRSLQPLTHQFFWESGDDIKLELSNTPKASGIYSDYLFTGHGHEKYMVQKDVPKFWKDASRLPRTKDLDTVYQVPNRSICLRLLKAIDDNGGGMSPLSIAIVKSEAIMQQGYGINYCFGRILASQKNAIDSQFRKALYEKCLDIFSGRGLVKFDSLAFSKSARLINFQLQGLETESDILFGRRDKLWIYQQIKKRFTRDLRDEMIAASLTSGAMNDSKLDSIYWDAKKVLRSKLALNQLERIEHLVLKPTFSNYTLTDINNKAFSLKQLQGKTVFIDFWWTGCGACAAYYANVLLKVEGKFKNDPNVVFVSISLDREYTKWVKSIQKGIYTSGNAINLYTSGKGFLNPIVSENDVIGGPTVILLDKELRVKYFNTSQLYEIKSLIESIQNVK